MNTNFFHNILNFVGLIIGTILFYDWTALGISPETAASLSAGLLIADKVIKLAINITRDGFSGLVKPQPPVG